MEKNYHVIPWPRPILHCLNYRPFVTEILQRIWCAHAKSHQSGPVYPVKNKIIGDLKKLQRGKTEIYWVYC